MLNLNYRKGSSLANAAYTILIRAMCRCHYESVLKVNEVPYIDGDW